MTSSGQSNPAGSGLRAHLGSIAHLLTGNMANAAIMLVSVGIAARALGPDQYGVMVLVLAFGRTVERLVRFESWQPIIKFAADVGEQQAQDGSDEGTADETARRRLSRLYCYGLLLDIGSALAAAAIIVMAGGLGGPLLGLDTQHRDLVAVYAIAIALNITGMPTASLRFSGRFRTIAYATTLSSVLRIALAFVGLWAGGGLMAFIVIWTAAQVFGAMFFLWLGFRALAEQGIPSPLRAGVRGLREEFPAFLPFAWSTNVSTALRTLTTEADALLVGALAGAAPAGFYHIAKRIAKVALQVGSMTQAVLYPDMARMWARGQVRALREMTARVQLVLGLAGGACLLGAAVLGRPVIGLALGHDYLPSFPLLLAQLVAVIFLMHGAPSRSALLAMDRPGAVLNLALVGTVVFFAVSVVLIPQLGAMGAVCGQIALAAVTGIGMDLVWRHEITARAGHFPETG